MTFNIVQIQNIIKPLKCANFDHNLTNRRILNMIKKLPLLIYILHFLDTETIFKRFFITNE